jgi:hypothetical protein
MAWGAASAVGEGQAEQGGYTAPYSNKVQAVNLLGALPNQLLNSERFA